MSEARLGWLPVPCGVYLLVVQGIQVGLTLRRPPEMSGFSPVRGCRGFYTEEQCWERVHVAGEVQSVGASVSHGAVQPLPQQILAHF